MLQEYVTFSTFALACYETDYKISQLALKHRQNKQQHQRIIVFTCSPVAESQKDIEKLSKRLKKNGISVDIIAFGDLDSDVTQKLEAFHENNKSSMGTTHLAIIPPGPNLLSDSIVATPILAGDGMGGGSGGDGDVGMGGMGGGGGGGDGFEFGVDPSTDPELALALRMSMEEEERRQARERADQEATDKPKLEAVQEEGQGSSAGAEGGDAGEGKSDKKDDDKMDTA